MNDLVGIIRREHEMTEALKRLAELRDRAAKVAVTGGRAFNPGWHLALDLRNMLLVSECVARAALIREESRGGHTREDFPKMSPEWRQKNLVCALSDEVPDGEIDVQEQPVPDIRADLMTLFEHDELSKYFTDAELPAEGAAAAAEES
jgi:succinate dehydrogenase / fumarate reductase flavoprotein subunit